MRTATAQARNGIQWTPWLQFDDLDFADDLALLSHTHQQMPEKTNSIKDSSAQIGLHINREKTKVLRINITITEPVRLDDDLLDEVNSDLYQLMSMKNLADTLANHHQQQRSMAKNQRPADAAIMMRRWRWIGHTLRKPSTNITRQALSWNPQGKRKRGRPRNSWRRDLKADIKRLGLTWSQLERKAQARDSWRTLVGGLCPRGDGGGLGTSK